MNFRCKFRQRRSIPWPRFPVRVQNFGDLATFSVDVCILYILNVRHISTITVPIDYHWKCVRGHCACAESRDPWVGGQKQLHFYDLPIHYTTFIGLRRWHLFYKQSYSKYSVKTRWIFVTLATRVVWAKFDWHHLIGRSRKPTTACKHLGRTSCTR